MDFAFTPEQIQLRRAVRDFAEAEIGPHVRKWDDSEIFPLETIRKLGGLGYMGAILPEELGGAGLGYIEYCIVIEELSRVDGSVGISIAAHNSLCSNHIYKYGSEEQKRQYLVALASGEHLGAWGLTEPSAGSDASGTKSTAVRSDGGWMVNGSKNFITHAIHADTCVAMAVTDKAKRSKGISAFIFEKGMQGFSPSKKENKLGLRASETASVVFEDCFVPEGQLLGEEGQGFVNAMEVLDGGRISIAALAVGIAQGAFESAVRYSQERQQFGKPIAEFQAIQFKLADMATKIDAARMLMYRAAWLKDEGKKTTKESSMAKLFASEVSVAVCEEAIQIHGGYGYTKDYPPEKYWRDSKLCTIGEGTSEIQRIIIAREVLKQV
jgi:alkylation response protein AidB-like acyl-CoA dehydrogenase